MSRAQCDWGNHKRKQSVKYMGYDGQYYGMGMTKEEKLADLRNRLSGLTILKDVLKGTVYYAVVRDEKRGAVFCVVGKTVMNRDGYFMVKMMGDDEGPCYYDCPQSYIKMCTEPYNEWAREWREKCLERAGKGTVPMAERKFRCVFSVPVADEHGRAVTDENGKMVWADKEHIFTLNEMAERYCMSVDYLMRSTVIKRQKVGVGGFSIRGTDYTRVY